MEKALGPLFSITSGDPGYTDAGLAVSNVIRRDTGSALQDLTAEVMARHCPGIERGHRKRDRLAAGVDYAATLHRSVHRLHQDLPAEIAAREAELAALEAEAEELHASAAKTRRHLAALEAKVALSATEEKRQAAYAAHLAKKEEGLAALEQALDAMRQRVEAEGRAVVAGQARLRAEATAVFSEKEEAERAGQKAERAEEAARKEEAMFVERMMKRVKVRQGGNDLVADARKDGEELRRSSGVCPLPRRS